MVLRFKRRREAGWRRHTVVSAVGAVATGIVVIIELTTKFADGAWITLLLIALLVLAFYVTHAHYTYYARQLSSKEWPPVWSRKHVVVVAVAGVSKSTAGALAYALLLSGNVRAVAVATDPSRVQALQDEWDLWDSGVPLEVIISPYRAIVGPLLEYIGKVQEEEKPDWLTVVLPEVVPARWWHSFLHNQTVLAIKAALLFRKDTIVTSVPYHLKR
jgi:hypothetical protein